MSAIEPVLIPKNARETLRLSIGEFKGRTLLNCRVWYSPGEGQELKPGKEGWAISVERLPEIIIALQQLAAHARAAGLLPPEHPRPASSLARDWVERP